MPDLRIAIVHIGFFALAAWRLRGARALAGRRRHARIDAEGGSVFLRQGRDGDGYWMLDPVDRRSSPRSASPPNMVTLFSLLPAAGAAWRSRFGWFGLAAVLAVIARASATSSTACWRARRGRPPTRARCFDAAVDRYGEFFFLGGLVYYYRDARSVLFIVLARARRLVHGQLRDRQGRGDGRRRRRAAPCAGPSAPCTSIVGAAFTPASRGALFATSPSLALHELPIILALRSSRVVANVSVRASGSCAIVDALRAKDEVPPAQRSRAVDARGPDRRKPDAAGRAGPERRWRRRRAPPPRSGAPSRFSAVDPPPRHGGASPPSSTTA